jgi:hypothetical protein
MHESMSDTALDRKVGIARLTLSTQSERVEKVVLSAITHGDQPTCSITCISVTQ